MNLHNVQVTKSKHDMALSAITYFLTLHKWTGVMMLGTFLTVPAAMDSLPESAGIMGLLAFLFGAWKQFEDLKMRKEIHKERILLLKELRKKIKGDEIEIDGETLANLLNNS